MSHPRSSAADLWLAVYAENVRLLPPALAAAAARAAAPGASRAAIARRLGTSGLPRPPRGRPPREIVGLETVPLPIQAAKLGPVDRSFWASLAAIGRKADRRVGVGVPLEDDRP